MIKKIRQQYDIELNMDDLYALARACSVVEAITSSAIDDGVAGFKIASVPLSLNQTEYSIKEFSKCMQMLEDLCSPIGRLEGYFDKDSK